MYTGINRLHAAGLVAKTSRKWFYANELATIYKFPTTSQNMVVGVVSFGGGLFGNVSAEGVLTGGDVQAYWTALGITDQPRVIIKTLAGATNSAVSADDDGTAENTLDVETIGACCPTSKLTIILYIVPNAFSSFITVFNYIMSTPVVVGGVGYKPSIVSVSWGAPEIYFGYFGSSINTVLSTAAARGINICVATGDYGSNNGVGGTSINADFPSSSPSVIACGGTSLTCPNNVYDSSTREVAWTNGGGAVSRMFSKPVYQSALSGTMRLTADISSNSDPNTGVAYIVNKVWYVYGGTSIAAPTVAAYLACVNPPVFVNSRLYSAPSTCFNDILSGTNGAYFARTGYDNCTGRGSIIGNVLGPRLAEPNRLVTGLTLNTTSATLVVKKTLQLSCTVAPTNASNPVISWSSLNSRATVSSTGLVTALMPGAAQIVAYTNDGSKISVTVNITITATAPKAISVASVSLNVVSATFHVGQTYSLVASVLPLTATNKALVWSSSNPAIMTVSNGTVTALGKGTDTITVTTADQGKKATCTFTIT